MKKIFILICLTTSLSLRIMSQNNLKFADFLKNFSTISIPFNEKKHIDSILNSKTIDTNFVKKFIENEIGYKTYIDDMESDYSEEVYVYYNYNPIGKIFLKKYISLFYYKNNWEDTCSVYMLNYNYDGVFINKIKLTYFILVKEDQYIVIDTDKNIIVFQYIDIRKPNSTKNLTKIISKKYKIDINYPKLFLINQDSITSYRYYQDYYRNNLIDDPMKNY